MTKRITKAVFPVAGMGSRFLPATKAQPKEMLPIVDKPLIQYAVEEAVEAGITDLIFVTGRNKRAIEDHFDTAYELEDTLSNQGKLELLSLVQDIIPQNVNCIFIRQSRPLGLGHAVMCAKPVVGDDPFAVLLADDFMIGPTGYSGVLKQMIDIHETNEIPLVAVQTVPKTDVNQYGIVSISTTSESGVPNTGSVSRMIDIVEKPPVHLAKSNMAVVGRYVFNNDIFDFLEHMAPVTSGEIQLTTAIENMMAIQHVDAYNFLGQRFDCGSKLGYLKATVEMGLRHQDLGDDFYRYLKAKHG